MSDGVLLAIAIAAALLWIAWPDRQRRAWAMATIAGVALFLALRELPALSEAARPGERWNWSGHLLALAGMLVLGALLVRRAGLDGRALGFAWPLAWQSAAAVALAALLVNALANATIGRGRLADVPAETWLFLATMPGLVEELAFRGVLLAAAERAAPAKWRVAGVRLGPGALALTLAFVALHDLTAGTLISVLPAALLYLWLRLKTGSVLLPIITHNLWNLIVIATHL